MTSTKRGPPSTLVACVACHESHVVCGSERPCKRCITRGLADKCKDILPKKRGRPKKEQQNIVQEQANQSIPIECNNFVLPANIGEFTCGMDSLDPFETSLLEDLSEILNRPSSDPFQIEHNVQQLMTQPNSCPLQQSNCPEPLQPLTACSTFSQLCPPPLSPSSEPNILSAPTSDSLFCPSISSSCSTPLSPITPSLCTSTSTPIAEPGPYCLSGTSKFTSTYLEEVFTHIAQRMHCDVIPASLSPLLSKLVDFYEPLISMYGSRLLDMCPQRLMYINQLINEMNIPIIVYGVFSIINVNSAVRELLRQTKSHLLNKNIFDLIHPDDIPAFVKNSVECLVDFKEMERIRVRMLLDSDKYCQCVLTETIHKNQNGVPLFSSVALMRVDDV